MTGPSPLPPGSNVTITRRVPDAPEVVFGAFTDPDGLMQWWCPHGFRTVAIDFPAHTGRRYRVELRADDGATWVHEGQFLVVEPPSRLAYTWRWTEGPMSPAETLVELSFDADGSGTRITVSHTRFVLADEAGAHESGWAGALERLDAWLAARRSSSSPGRPR